MKERILSFCYTGKLLYIVDYQHVDSLVEADEIIEMIGTHRIGILYLKQVCRHVKHTFLRIKFLDTCTDSIYQMSFTHTRRTVNKKRIKGACRILRNGFGYSSRKLVAVSFDKVLKVIIGIQMRI